MLVGVRMAGHLLGCPGDGNHCGCGGVVRCGRLIRECPTPLRRPRSRSAGRDLRSMWGAMGSRVRTMPAGTWHEQSQAEELANSLSHGLALVAALIGGPYLIVQAVRRADAAFVVGTSLFCATIVVLYLASTLYHVLPAGRAKRVFRVIDHASIFLLIAGSYTPFTLGVLRGAWGWALFGVVWGLALAGIVLKSVGKASHPIFSTGLYLLMGWLVVRRACSGCWQAACSTRPAWPSMQRTRACTSAT